VSELQRYSSTALERRSQESALDRFISRLQHRFRAGHTSVVTSVAIDGVRGILASGSSDGSLRLWSLTDQQWVAVLIGFRPDSWFIATAEGYCNASSLELMEKVNHEVGDRFGRVIDPLILDPERVKEIFARRFGGCADAPETSAGSVPAQAPRQITGRMGE
jgi:hypothetical protein